MIVVSEDDVKKYLSIEKCIPLMADALESISKGEATQILRSAMKIEDRNLLGIMPSASLADKVAGVKVISVFPDNYSKGLPSHQGQVLVFETEEGKLKGIVNGDAITGIRTAAVSAVATNLLANKDASSLCIMGAGLQARMHLEAILLVRDIKNVTVWNIVHEDAVKYALEMEAKHGIPVLAKENPQEAVKDAHIVCTVTAAKTPILEGKWISEGTHINAIGACSKDCREIDSELAKIGNFYADDMESILNESGDYLIPLDEGVIDESSIKGTIGDALRRKINGRINKEQITIFEGLGLAVEDLIAANYIIGEIEKKKAQNE